MAETTRPIAAAAGTTRVVSTAAAKAVSAAVVPAAAPVNPPSPVVPSPVPPSPFASRALSTAMQPQTTAKVTFAAPPPAAPPVLPAAPPPFVRTAAPSAPPSPIPQVSGPSELRLEAERAYGPPPAIAAAVVPRVVQQVAQVSSAKSSGEVALSELRAESALPFTSARLIGDRFAAGLDGRRPELTTESARLRYSTIPDSSVHRPGDTSAVVAAILGIRNKEAQGSPTQMPLTKNSAIVGKSRLDGIEVVRPDASIVETIQQRGTDFTSKSEDGDVGERARFIATCLIAPVSRETRGTMTISEFVLGALRSYRSISEER